MRHPRQQPADTARLDRLHDEQHEPAALRRELPERRADAAAVPVGSARAAGHRQPDLSHVHLRPGGPGHRPADTEPEHAERARPRALRHRHRRARRAEPEPRRGGIRGRPRGHHARGRAGGWRAGLDPTGGSADARRVVPRELQRQHQRRPHRQRRRVERLLGGRRLSHLERERSLRGPIYWRDGDGAELGAPAVGGRRREPGRFPRGSRPSV